jgi:DNA-binding NarL/FixJ family response regulator
VPRLVCLCVRHPLVLEELSRLVAGKPFRTVACRLDADSIKRRDKLRVPRASLYVVDAPSRRETAEYLVAGILERFPKARLLVVAEELDESRSFDFLQMGARGLLRYRETSSQLLPALEALAAGGSWVPRSLLFRFIDRALRAGPRLPFRPSRRRLSPRENEVLALLLENLTNKEIAGRLHISSRTAKFHVSRLLAKYGVKRRGELLMMRTA